MQFSASPPHTHGPGLRASASTSSARLHAPVASLRDAVQGYTSPRAGPSRDATTAVGGHALPAARRRRHCDAARTRRDFPPPYATASVASPLAWTGRAPALAEALESPIADELSSRRGPAQLHVSPPLRDPPRQVLVPVPRGGPPSRGSALPRGASRSSATPSLLDSPSGKLNAPCRNLSHMADVRASSQNRCNSSQDPMATASTRATRVASPRPMERTSREKNYCQTFQSSATFYSAT